MTTSPIVVSAPGKIILMGEHAAVFGEPALVAAIDKRVSARLSIDFVSSGLRIHLPDVESDEPWSWSQLQEYASERRLAWQRWSDQPNRPFQEVLGPRRDHLVATAVGECLEWAGELPAFGAELTVTSDIPIGAGFGSSAAVATAVVGTMIEALGLRAKASTKQRLVLEAERRQHGAPSGVDGAAVARGGVVWVVPAEDGPRVEPIEADSSLLRRARIANTGTPPDTTGEVVAEVGRRRAAAPEAFDADLAGASAATRLFRKLLTEAPVESSREGHQKEVLRCWRAFSGWLRRIGVVPERPSRWIDHIEREGGAAKISGAGSLRGPGAGSFLVYHPEASVADALTQLEGLEPLDLKLGGAGVQREN